MDSSLVTVDGISIPFFNNDYKYFLNKSILLYGYAHTGKTSIIKDIILCLKDHIKSTYHTGSCNGSYNESYDILPFNCIYTKLTEDLIKNIFKEQTENINSNSHCLLILDDINMESYKILNNSNEFKELFYKNEYYKITIIIGSTSNLIFSSSLNKNMNIVIFTNEDICNSFFERVSNNFTKVERNQMNDLAKVIFNKDNKSYIKKYKKMVYIKDKDPNVHYLTVS